MKKQGDHHLSQRGGKEETAPLPQHKRFAMGEKLSGSEADPYGAESADKGKKIGNARKTY